MLKYLSIVALSFCSVVSAQDKPNKTALIKVLSELNASLIAEDYESAAKLVKLPAGLEKSDYANAFDGILKRRELSVPGIARLASEADFGLAADKFGKERAEAMFGKSGVAVGDIYGFYFETPEATAEVAAVWVDGKFLLMRFDDVGKLAPSAEAVPEQTPDEAAESVVSIKELFEAVQADPKNHETRARLAVGMYQTNDFENSWKQIRIAASLSTEKNAYAGGQASLLKEFEKAGEFSIGVTADEIEKLLGDPDQEVEMSNDGSRSVYSYIGIDFEDGKVSDVIDLRSATEAMFNPTEVVAVDLDGREWSTGLRKKGSGVVSETWFLEGESIKGWTEQFEIRRELDVSKDATVEEFAQAMIDRLKAANPKAKANVLASDENSATIAFEIPIEKNGMTMHRLVRLIKGPKDLHQISLAMVKRPSEAVQKEWFERFQKAHLKPIK